MSILSAFFILLIFFYYFLCYNIYSDSSDILLEVFLWLISLKNLLLKVVPIFPSLKVITPLKSVAVLIVPSGGAHRTYKSLASVETWKAKGIDDPIAYFQKEVDELNKNNKNKDSLKISNHSPELYLGYFPFVSMMNKMDIKKYVDYFNLHNSFEFDLYELLSSLIYARLVNPCSKHRTFHEVLPQLRNDIHFSYDQLLDGLEFSASINLVPVK